MGVGAVTKWAGLDPGLTFGWALLDGQRARSGSHDLRQGHPSASIEAAAEHAREWLYDLLHDLAPIRVFIAEPFVNRQHDTARNAVPLFGLILAARIACHRRGIPWQQVKEFAARKQIIGGIPKGPNRKKAHIEAVQRLGWPATDGHAADALIVAAYGRALYEPERAFRDTPLFAGKPWLKARISA